jgi:eukaryotic-like serine/threonine-protein kinase
MDQANAYGARRLAVGLTQEYVNGNAGPSKPRPRCRLAHGSGPGSNLTSEQVSLLASRLRIASLIHATAVGVFFIRNIFQTPEMAPDWTLSISLCGSMTVFTGVLAGLLWARRDLCGPYLRFIEGALFGGMALFFSVMQILSFNQGHILQFAAPGREAFFIRTAAVAFSVRWFSLVVLYGAFIPNTWRRCAIVIGVIASLPILINASMALLQSSLRPYGAEMVFDTAIIMAVASAIGIFGSYKISSLHQEAVEAKKLGQYVLKEKLGAGGMGEVYLAEHMLLRRPSAIKLIRPEQAGDPANLSRFEREVRATAKLTHWNTVEIYDYGRTEDGTFYYVMEYLPGLSLQDMVEQYGPLPPERVIHFLRQVCQALREAHGFGIIHRDIKPSNILACERGGVHDVAKLLDFGLVQCTGIRKQDANKLTMQGTIVGSPPFMSPEQASGKDDLDLGTDIYSLGGVGYFMLTGKAPFERDTAIQMLMAHAYEPLVYPGKLRPDLPEDLQAVIVHCLEKDPRKRFPDAESLDHALAQCAAAGLWTEEQAMSWWKDKANGTTLPQNTQPTVAAPALTA